MVNEGQYGGPLKFTKINKENKVEKSVLLKNGESLYISQLLGVDKNDLIY
ncbi:MAG: hypothetical protein ACPLWB_01000 [Caldisericia bacterium]